MCQRILLAKADQPDALHLLGLVAYRENAHDLAVGYISRSIAHAPAVPEGHNNLGDVKRAQGKLEEAAVCYRNALRLKPAYAVAHCNLGATLSELGRLDEAVMHCRQALALDPALVEARNNLGNALKEQGKLDEAVAQFRQALVLRPTLAEAHNNLGNTLKEQGRLQEAIAQYQQALTCSPKYAEAHSNLGLALQAQGRIEESLEQFRQALAVRPGYIGAYSNLLFGLHYLHDCDSGDLYALHQDWNERYAKSFSAQIVGPGNLRDAARALRIGYVSADFKRHPIGHFVEPVLGLHDRSQFKVYCYSMVVQADDMTARIRKHADEWREIAGVNDDDVADLIKKDGIDVLIDLSGHTDGNRLLVFARKPAPVQATWLGYFNTTGLTTMDYVIVDSSICPPEGGQMFVEELVTLPHGYVFFHPPEAAPPVAPSPAALRGYPTFGCFNNLSKVTPEVVALWSRILRSAPEARIMLKSKALIDRDTQERYRRLFQEHGIVPGRVDLLGSSPYIEMLDAYGQVDIALDPFPYCGGRTTCEALWMGVPVITLAGSTFAGRLGVSYLANAGLAEYITTSAARYTELAVNLCRDPGRLASLREGLRVQVARSPLCDAAGFIRGLERAYRSMWRNWCTA